MWSVMYGMVGVRSVVGVVLGFVVLVSMAVAVGMAVDMRMTVAVGGAVRRLGFVGPRMAQWSAGRGV